MGVRELRHATFFSIPLKILCDCLTCNVLVYIERTQQERLNTHVETRRSPDSYRQLRAAGHATLAALRSVF